MTDNNRLMTSAALLKNSIFIKEKFQSKKGKAQMKELEKCKNPELSLSSMRQMVLEIFQFKFRNWSKIDVAIL